MNTTQKKIWAAGFMDGEGTITIKRWVRYGKIHYQPYISCCQVQKPLNIEAIKILQELFGGSISMYTQKPNTSQRLDTIQWSIVSQNALQCAKILLPYLQIKKVQCKLLISFYSETNQKKGNYRLNEHDHLIRSQLWEKMSKLNVRGKLRLQRLSEKTA